MTLATRGHARQLEKPASANDLRIRVGIATRSAQFVLGRYRPRAKNRATIKSAGSTPDRPLSSSAPEVEVDAVRLILQAAQLLALLALGLGERVRRARSALRRGWLALGRLLATSARARDAVRAIACLTSSRYSERSTISGAAPQLDRHAGGAGLVDLGIGEPHRGPP